MRRLRKFMAGCLTIGVGLAGSWAAAQGPAPVVPAPVYTPAVPPASNVQAGPVDVQSTPWGTNVTVAPGAAAAVGQRIADNASVRQENRQERIATRQAERENWRMRNVNGNWWYWGPNNQWSVYRNNAWTPYTAGAMPGIVAPGAFRPGGQRQRAGSRV